MSPRLRARRLAALLLLGSGLAAAADAPHALRSARLRDVMVRLDALVYERMYTELDLDTERARHAGALADAAADLAGTTDALPELAGGLALTDAEAGRFRDLANRLYSQAVEIQGLASREEYRQLRPAFERLQSTCGACHALFRDPPPAGGTP